MQEHLGLDAILEKVFIATEVINQVMYGTWIGASEPEGCFCAAVCRLLREIS